MPPKKIPQPSTVTQLYRSGTFRSREGALGAFELARQQYLDGMGKTPREHLGLTEDEYDEFMRTEDYLPKCRKFVWAKFRSHALFHAGV